MGEVFNLAASLVAVSGVNKDLGEQLDVEVPTAKQSALEWLQEFQAEVPALTDKMCYASRILGLNSISATFPDENHEKGFMALFTADPVLIELLQKAVSDYEESKDESVITQTALLVDMSQLGGDQP